MEGGGQGGGAQRGIGAGSCMSFEAGNKPM
jgi:hypothetical protein